MTWCQEENHIEKVLFAVSCCWWFHFYTDSLRDWNADFMEALFILFQQCFTRHHAHALICQFGALVKFKYSIKCLTICTPPPQKSKLVNYVICNYTYLKLQIVNFGDGTCRDPLASHRMGPSWKKCQASLPVMVLVCLCVGGVIVLEMPGLLTTNNT